MSPDELLHAATFVFVQLQQVFPVLTPRWKSVNLGVLAAYANSNRLIFSHWVVAIDFKFLGHRVDDGLLRRFTPSCSFRSRAAQSFQQYIEMALVYIDVVISG